MVFAMLTERGLSRRESSWVKWGLLVLVAAWALPVSAQSERVSEGASATTPEMLALVSGTLDGWTIVEGAETWRVDRQPPIGQGNPSTLVNVNSLSRGGEAAVGVLRSAPFVISHATQQFLIAGADGMATGANNGELNFLLLCSHPDGQVLRREHTPGGHVFREATWATSDLIGREVYLELVDRNPGLHAGAYGWIGVADYRQEDWPDGEQPVERDDLFGLKIDESAKRVVCRTVPFLVAPPQERAKTRRVVEGTTETIPVGAIAQALYILGLTNEGWDNGLAFWSEHPELWKERPDQLYIGVRIGEIEIRYADGTNDRVPLVIGQTAWFGRWYGGQSEPFASRDDYRAEFERRTKFREDRKKGPQHERYYVGIKTRGTEIVSLVIHDNPKKNGRPLISAVTLAGAQPVGNLVPFGALTAATGDLEPRVKAEHTGDWSDDITALSDLLYTSEAQLPKHVELLDFPDDLNAARIRFVGDRWADMLSNIWVANLTQIDREKFEVESGFFRESEKGGPSYGGYMGVGVWGRVGSYHHWAFSRSSDHYATLALRLIDNDRRLTSYVDFVDKWLYYHRANRDSDKGPPNEKLDVTKYPKDAPPHWSFIVNGPMDAVPTSVNEISGNEEMDGHGSTVVGRWVAWRMLGAPRDDWLTQPREAVYGKSRWDSTRDSADFIVWLMDYTGRDVIYCEGESTGWNWGERIPPGMENETDRAKLERYYANMNMFEPYPTYVCLTALRCAATMADAVGEDELAKKYRAHADRLQTGMLRQLVEGMKHELTWRLSPYSVYPLPHHCLVQAWFSMYYDGLDPQRLDPAMTQISRNTLDKLLAMECGHHPVFGFGYGLGWLTQSALILDELDDAGKCLVNIAKYSYDKNMDYVDEERGIDWRRWLWLIPEGTNLLPTGRWYRIGDLSNGANQGITLHVLETCAGIDDTKPAELKILPRVPDPLTGVEVTDFPVLIPDGDSLACAKVTYTYDRKTGAFALRSDRPLPSLAVRLGPLDRTAAQRLAEQAVRPSGARVRVEASGRYDGCPAWWVWFEDMKAVATLHLGP